MPHFVSGKKKEWAVGYLNSNPKLSLQVSTHRFIKIDAHRFAEYSMQCTASITPFFSMFFIRVNPFMFFIFVYSILLQYWISCIYFLQLSLIKSNQSQDSQESYPSLL